MTTIMGSMMYFYCIACTCRNFQRELLPLNARYGLYILRVCVRVCVRACVRACVHVCVCVCVCVCERLTFYSVLIQHFLSNPSSQSTKPLFSLAIAIGIIKVIMYHENILSLDKRNNQSKQSLTFSIKV